MCLLVAVGVFITTLGGANAASVQDEARQFFERFVAAQNAHDLDTVGSMLWNSEDFLWVTRGVQVRGSKTALNVFGSYYKGTWHLDPDTNCRRLHCQMAPYKSSSPLRSQEESRAKPRNRRRF